MQTLGQYPNIRMRRMRRDAFSRDLMRENVLTPADLIYPVFVLDGNNRGRGCDVHAGRAAQDPGQAAAPGAEECVKLGIPALAMFPVIDAAAQKPGCARSLQPGWPGAARGAR